MTTKAPTRRTEQALWEAGHDVVVGIDEVGRGAWAGPLMVGAAVLPRDKRVYKVRDSKVLTEAAARAALRSVASWCTAWAVGAASQAECDELGMAEAQRVAARRAVEGLGLAVDAAVVDGTWDFVGDAVPHIHRMVKADAYCLPVAAASILAKVTRDRVMRAGGRHVPALVVRHQQGLPVPGPQGRARRATARAPSTAARGCSWTTTCRGRACGSTGPGQPTLFDADSAGERCRRRSVPAQHDAVEGLARGRRRGRRRPRGPTHSRTSDAGTSSAEPGDRRVRHAAGVLDQALDRAERLGQREQLGALHDLERRPPRRPRTGSSPCPPKSRICLAAAAWPGWSGSCGYSTRSHGRVADEQVDDGPGVLAVAVHPHGQRLQRRAARGSSRTARARPRRRSA